MRLLKDEGRTRMDGGGGKMLENPSDGAAKKNVTEMVLGVDGDIPPETRVKLDKLFRQIEKEFESLYLENLSLRDKVDQLTERPEHEQLFADRTEDVDGPSQARRGSSNIKVSGSISSGRLKSHTSKLKYQTNKIMSGLKTGPPLTASPVKRYCGHVDGVWDVGVSRLGDPVLGTASADYTAKVWGMHSGLCLLEYQGHQGSVNSIRFHPSKELVLTTSGDGSAHIWQCSVNLLDESSSGRVASSEDELDSIQTRETQDETVYDEGSSVLRTPLRSLAGHAGVVIHGDWFPGGEQVVTGGWDKVACIWDASTGQLLNQMGGHDQELTHTATHPTQQLVSTSSKDSTFRLWDFRESIHSVMVFQGHQESVTSSEFVPNTDFLVSGSDDRTAKVWDIRNMRSAVVTIQSDSALNRVSVSKTGLIALPHDNRNVRVFDLTGQRVARLSRSSRQGHTRMVCSTAWAGDLDQRPNLFTAGFDRQVIGWSVHTRHHHEEKEGFRLKVGLNAREQRNREFTVNGS